MQLRVPIAALGAVLLASLHLQAQQSSTAHWPQWGGPHRNFIVGDAGLAAAWPESGPPLLWSRPLGTGHSAIVVDDGRIYTMYRVGNGRARQGPWEAEEIVIAMDASTGKTIWEHKYPSRREDFSFGAGPHSTPLIVGDRLFTIGTNQQLFALDKRSGKVLWSHDLIEAFGSPELLIRPVVKVGYGCSPIAFRDTIICSVGGPGQSVMAFRQHDGTVAWKSGDFLTSAAAPVLIDFEGQPQLVFLAGGTVTAIDPQNGSVLWSHAHDPGNDLNCATPLWGSDNVLFVSSAYKAGSRAIQLKKTSSGTATEELWFTNRVRFMFLNAVRVGDFVYGTTGDFGPAFLTALNVKTGEAAWQHRGFGRASLLQAGDKTIIMDEDGDLALARLTPAGATILAQAKIFDTTTWTAPTLVGTTLFARDREKIVALNLGASTVAPSALTPVEPPSPDARRVRDAANAANVPDGRTTSKAGSGSGAANAPGASLAGTWRLDQAQSRIDAGAGIAGLIGAGAPPMLFITQPANGQVIVESPINEGHVRIYQPGGKTQTPAGQGGTVSMTARWAERTLRSEGSVVSAAGVQVTVSESYEVSADGRVLTVEVTTSSPDAKQSSLKYQRIASVGGCETWPTPCKR
jgi:outer membrane protein assembly factor BamB